MVQDLLPFNNIIFDLGGVILDLDFQQTINKFEKLGIRDFGKKYSYFKSDKIYANLEMGKADVEDFYREIRKLTSLKITNDQIDDAWNAMLINIPKERVDLLE